MSKSNDDAPQGQVSEVAAMGDASEPIDPSDATSGTPDGESGRPQEGAAGPDASPPENVADREH
jgi:hypothetical protein